MANLAAFLVCCLIVSTVRIDAFGASDLGKLLGNRPGRPNRGQNCPQGWTYYNGFCYKLIRDYVNYRQAKRGCQAKQAFVVDIQSTEEQGFVYGTVVADGGVQYWIGLTDKAEEGVWKWDRTGEIATYTNWAPFMDQPDGGVAENCVVTGFIDLQQWSDMKCRMLANYVCKKAA